MYSMWSVWSPFQIQIQNRFCCCFNDCAVHSLWFTFIVAQWRMCSKQVSNVPAVSISTHINTTIKSYYKKQCKGNSNVGLAVPDQIIRPYSLLFCLQNWQYLMLQKNIPDQFCTAVHREKKVLPDLWGNQFMPRSLRFFTLILVWSTLIAYAKLSYTYPFLVASWLL